ncbi:hypothetical protein DFA_00543 [Cavenderia fasciculata]|uniref:WD40 repeat-containing protein n=1 Tax=Cavenderia fasciculata TaxID=261658 RepID=F4PSD6_CACFS|nr:uncharacterized protein DFA_00543 [Cavenderia fasciculata]EGG20682.1 hypothetical protein DFA_00543 [Cavenderia fasciculata]|eukprot:XP_004358532.1 hypothetical protein DFA_00543 [Cavenderia fasciculata]
MGIGKVFKDDNTAPINSMDFCGDGTLLITASDDESIHLYNINSGDSQKQLYSKKYGVDLIRFTHHNDAIICASKNQWDESLRYLSLHDNRYLRYFKGHRNKVVSLSMSPVNDTFMSGSLDDTIRLWDLRTNVCQGIIRRNGRPSLSYDPEGIILATAVSGNSIKLYDVRNFDKGPFSNFIVHHPQPVEWTGMKFSNDDGSVHVWRTLTGEEIAVWGGHHSKVGCVQWNPKLMMAASACSTLSFWIPSINES